MITRIIYTDHANERMFERDISESLVHKAIEHSDKHKLEADGDTQFIKKVKRQNRNRNLHVIAKPMPEQGKDTWLIKTVWIRGEDDPNPILKAFRLLLMRLFHRKYSTGCRFLSRYIHLNRLDIVKYPFIDFAGWGFDAVTLGFARVHHG